MDYLWKGKEILSIMKKQELEILVNSTNIKIVDEIKVPMYFDLLLTFCRQKKKNIISPETKHRMKILLGFTWKISSSVKYYLSHPTSCLWDNKIPFKPEHFGWQLVIVKKRNQKKEKMMLRNYQNILKKQQRIFTSHHRPVLWHEKIKHEYKLSL